MNYNFGMVDIEYNSDQEVSIIDNEGDMFLALLLANARRKKTYSVKGFVPRFLVSIDIADDGYDLDYQQVMLVKKGKHVTKFVMSKFYDDQPYIDCGDTFSIPTKDIAALRRKAKILSNMDVNDDWLKNNGLTRDNHQYYMWS